MVGILAILAPIESPVRDLFNRTKLVKHRVVRTKLQGFKVDHTHFGKTLMVKTGYKITYFSLRFFKYEIVLTTFVSNHWQNQIFIETQLFIETH